MRHYFTGNPSVAGLDEWGSIDDLSTLKKLCEYCSRIAKSSHRVGRLEFWDQLPSLFDLPPWEELLKEREDMYVFNDFPADAISISVCRA